MTFPHEQDIEPDESAATEEEHGAAELPRRQATFGRFRPGQAGAAEPDPAGPDDVDDDMLADDDVIVAEVIDTDPDEDEAASGYPDRPLAATTATGAESGAGAEAAVQTEPEAAVSDAAASERPFSAEHLSQEWREIQASFVDDPRGAVQLAAEAADAALTALMTSLRDRQATLGPTAAQDTEQLRAALQEYRKFCQGLAETGRRFAVG